MIWKDKVCEPQTVEKTWNQNGISHSLPLKEFKKTLSSEMNYKGFTTKMEGPVEKIYQIGLTNEQLKTQVGKSLFNSLKNQ